MTSSRSVPPAVSQHEPLTSAVLIRIAQRFNHEYGHIDDGPVCDRWDPAQVPAGDVGSPPNQSVLESTAAYSVLDNGAPPVIGPGPGNVPTVVDVTRAYNALLLAPAGAAPRRRWRPGCRPPAASQPSSRTAAADGLLRHGKALMWRHCSGSAAACRMREWDRCA